VQQCLGPHVSGVAVGCGVAAGALAVQVESPVGGVRLGRLVHRLGPLADPAPPGACSGAVSSLITVSELPEDWQSWRERTDPARYDDYFRRMGEAGQNLHGEADLVASYRPASVLDGGCGTGRVGIELARRGIAVLGVDADADMIAAARAKAPDLEWVTADLSDLDRPERFDVVVLAGNVVPYAAPQRRAAAVAACVRHLAPGGRLIAGFQLRPGWPTLEDYDGWGAAAGVALEDRYATWDRAPYEGGDYAVSVHRRL
jgi:SAM-dependent methyltransferase